jgi:acyl-CoA synthetase (AMP-forming)/AMP-acid ligase II/alkylation response protein AidB-like acyl-CoA dehydrogenase
MTMNCSTLIDLVQNRAEKDGQRVAYTFLEDGVTIHESLTYGGLFERARAIAAQLQALNAAGERALLLYPSGLEFLAALFGCLLAGVIAIPVPVPEASRIKRSAPRLRAVVEDAAASLVLSTATVRAGVEGSQILLFDPASVRWVDTDRVAIATGTDWRRPAISRQQLAYLQYTSGSTSSPKGVMVSHGNVLDHLQYLQSTCGYTCDSVTVTWMPHFHDYGLVEGLLEPLYNGTPVFFMPPLAFVKRPVVWLQAIGEQRATHSHGPNFAYDHCLRRVTAEQRSRLDLSSWRAAGIGAEPINPLILTAFHRAFEPCGFRWHAFCPAYGLAEATLMVSFSPQGEAPLIKRLQISALERRRVVEARDGYEPAREIVGCGRLFGATQVVIVNPETRAPCGSDELGEIWVWDTAIVKGYWARPAETSEVFDARIATTGQGPFLRTGDLGFLCDDQLFVAGRLKDLIIIRGTNHYPQDIEWTVQRAHAALRPECGAAFSVLVDGEEKLVVAQELERDPPSDLDRDALAQRIREAIADEHEINVFAILLLASGSLPKTTSGKIQRAACREAYLNGRWNPVFAWTRSTSDTQLSGLNRIVEPDRSSRVTMDDNSNPDNPHRQLPSEEAAAAASRWRADQLIGWLREYAETRINSRLIDERRCIPPYVMLDFGNQGVLGMQVPERYGGLALRYHDLLRTLEQLAAIDLTLATVVFLNNTNGIRPIQHFATPELRDDLLPRLASGRELAAFALSEPGAGSHLGALSTAARSCPGGWRLTGVKRWNASSWASVVNVFARLVENDGRLGKLTGFVVRQGAVGLRIGPEALTMGLRGSVQNSLFLEDVQVGSDQLLGLPGDGMAVVEDALRISRLCTAAVSVGAMKRCVQLIVRYATRRQVSTGRLLDNPCTLATLSALAAETLAVEHVTRHVANLLDRSEACPTEISMVAKVAGTEHLNWAASELMQLLGGRGYMENNLAPQLLRDARALSIGEGPNEGLTMYIGRSESHTQSISRFLQDSLRAAKLAEIVRNASSAADARWRQSSSHGADPAAGTQWAHMLIGRLAIEAVLLASVQAESHSDQSRSMRQAVAWIQRRFELAREQALHGTGTEAVTLSASEAMELATSYTLAIGEVEQALAGEDQDVDPFVQRSPVADTHDEPTGTPLAASKVGGESPNTQPEDMKNSLAQLSRTAKQELLQRIFQKESGDGNRSVTR